MRWDAGGEGCPDYNGGVLRDKLGAQIIMEGGCRRGGGAQTLLKYDYRRSEEPRL